jgi:kynurenine formamidase
MARWTRRPDGSNWGDFGENDRLGRLNLLTPERRLRGVAEVREGLAFALSLPLDFPGGSAMSNGSRQPPKLFASRRGDHVSYHTELGRTYAGCCDLSCDDGVTLHTQYSTQWDSLAHWGQQFDADGDGVAEKVYYNGYRAGTDLLGPDDEGGPNAGPLGLDHMAAAGAQGRGVLVNLHAIHGAARVAVGYDGLMRAIETQRVTVEPGDFLLLYTGFDDALLGMKKSPDMSVLGSFGAVLNGADPRLLQWITDSGVVALCSDNLAVEGLGALATPDHRHTVSVLPLHEHCLFKLGVYLGELWFLRDLAGWLAANGRSAFLLTAPPLRLPGAVGSPVTPIATV